jgi:hypothetical protein
MGTSHSITPIRSAIPNAVRRGVRAGARACGSLLVVLSAACADPIQPVAPTTQRPSDVPSPPLGPPPAFPTLSRPGTIYVGDLAIYDAFASWHGSRIASRYVFYEDGTFALQFASQRNPFFEYKGRFTQTDFVITFDWDGWSSAGPWGATGTLSGDALSVKYNVVMMLTDFIDGVYVREPPP